MAYAVCGNTRCIVDEVMQVVRVKNNAALVKPAIAGRWGVTETNRPSLESQMDALRRSAPQIRSVSHWSFSWQDPEFDRERKFGTSRSSTTDLETLRQGSLRRQPLIPMAEGLPESEVSSAAVED